jgi:hypothetical protein
MDSPNGSMRIVPGQSIGALRLGMESKNIPKGAAISGGGGVFEGVRFSLGDDDRIADLWIEDVRVFPGKLSLDGRELRAGAPLGEVKEFFGGCIPVEGIKGGRFFNCKSGVALGSPYDGSDGFIQLRITHR